MVTWIAGAYNPNYLITKTFRSIKHVFNDTSELSCFLISILIWLYFILLALEINAILHQPNKIENDYFPIWFLRGEVESKKDILLSNAEFLKAS